MTTILLIRHGTTDYVNETLAGRIDSPLNHTGVEQAQKLANLLSSVRIAAIYASPLQRTQQTAQPLADQLSLSVQIEEDLNQVNFGDWQGISFDQLENDPRWITFQKNPALLEYPGGESAVEVRKRVTRSIHRLCEKHPNDAILAIFSHGSIIRHLVSALIGLPMENLNRLRIAPASVTTLIVEGNTGNLKHLNQEINVNWL